MILLVTNERDLTSDYVVLELKRRNIEFFRLNSERLSDSKIAFDPKQGEPGWVIDLSGLHFDFSKVRAAYYRRPGVPSAPKQIDSSSLQHYCVAEWSAALSAAVSALGPRWLNSPSAIRDAENKPMQLCLAASLGFAVPDTIITNDLAEVQRRFQDSGCIAKPLREALIRVGEEERVLFTTKVTNVAEIEAMSLAAAPVIFQTEIQKKYDVRVTVIGSSVYAVEIHSQELDDTKVDWRRDTHIDLKHVVHELPAPVAEQCVALTRALGLRFGAIDFVLDRDGCYWFLEINPNGQWAWLENRTGLPLTRAIVDELMAICA